MGSRIEIKRETIAIYCLLLVSAIRWFIRGYYGHENIVNSIILIFGLCCIFKAKFSSVNYFWILYSVAIAGNVIFFTGWASRKLMPVYVLLALFPVLSTIHRVDSYYEKYIKTIIGFGTFVSLSVILQFFLGDRFNEVVRFGLREPFYSLSWGYIRGKYFSGICYAPHDASGFICFALFSFIITLISIKKSIKAKHIFLMVILVLAFLLTQKKGIILSFIISLFLVFTFVNADKRNIGNLIIYLFFFVVMLSIIFFYMRSHLDNPIFYRLNKLFTALLNDEEVTFSGRTVLYRQAWSLWSEKKLFGIGWRRFNSLAFSTFNESINLIGHEVNCDYLQFLCELGVIGTIFVLIPIFVEFYRSVFVLRIIRKDKEMFVKYKNTIIAVLLNIFTLIYAFVEIPFNDETFLGIYFFSCIVINSAYSNFKKSYVDTQKIPMVYKGNSLHTAYRTTLNVD